VVIALLAALAAAAPVLCDPLAAATVLAEARIEERRAPVSHPELLPGLARASSRATSDLRLALADLCSGAGSLSLAAGDAYEGPSFSAYTTLLTRSERRDCVLYQRTVAISVATSEGAAPVYSLRGYLPLTLTPSGDCTAVATWRDERVLAGQAGPVRLVLASTWEGGTRSHSEVLVRTATAQGWVEQTLLAPAPPRLLGAFDGATIALVDAGEESWIVASGDRRADGGTCVPAGDQAVWRWQSGGWRAERGRDALGLLASRGLWRHAGDDGWLLIVTQADEEDADKLATRVARIARHTPVGLTEMPSAWFPLLNAGFVVAAPAPFATEAEARAARRAWAYRRRRTYVKQAWEAPDPCAETP
jgi:hypothetical protein